MSVVSVSVGAGMSFLRAVYQRNWRNAYANINASAAANLGVENAVVRAVAQVESGGRTGFGADGRPIIRYELHRFEKFTAKYYHSTHPHLSQPTLAAGNPYHVGGQANEWSLLY